MAEPFETRRVHSYDLVDYDENRDEVILTSSGLRIDIEYLRRLMLDFTDILEFRQRTGLAAKYDKPIDGSNANP